MLSLAPDAIGLSADTTLSLPNSLLLLKSVGVDAAGVDAAEAHAKAEATMWAVAGDAETHARTREEVLPYVAGSERAVISKGGVAAARAHRTALECTVMVIKVRDLPRSHAFHTISYHLTPSRTFSRHLAPSRAFSHLLAPSRTFSPSYATAIQIVADYGNASSVQRTTQAVQIIQRILYKYEKRPSHPPWSALPISPPLVPRGRYEAAFKHFVQMGHGGLAVTGFGLPPFTLKPAACARRAVAAGCDVRAKLAQIGVFCTVGISAGPVCIGCLPSAERIEYVIPTTLPLVHPLCPPAPSRRPWCHVSYQVCPPRPACRPRDPDGERMHREPPATH